MEFTDCYKSNKYNPNLPCTVAEIKNTQAIYLKYDINKVMVNKVNNNMVFAKLSCVYHYH